LKSSSESPAPLEDFNRTELPPLLGSMLFKLTSLQGISNLVIVGGLYAT
jgi:hypothetical protein